MMNAMKTYIKVIVLIFDMLCLASCMGVNEEDLVSKHFPPQVFTGETIISDKTTNVILNGLYRQSGSNTGVDECGFYYGEDPSLISSERFEVTDKSENFCIAVIPQNYGETYYYQAYVSNGRTELTSEIKSFHMPDLDYFVKLSTPSVVYEKENVSVSATMEIASGISLTEVGVLYGKTPELAESGIKVKSLDSQINNVVLKDFSYGDHYYICSYAMSGKYIAYSETADFLPRSVPTLTTMDVTDIGYRDAVFGATDISENGSAITRKGFVWSKDPAPTINLSRNIQVGEGGGNYARAISDLIPGTKYYVRAYAENSEGVGYGNEVSFTTLSLDKPKVTTSDVSSVSTTSVIAGGKVVDSGGSTIEARGVVWRTKNNPTIGLSTKTYNGTGAGTFTSTVTGLTPGTTYYLRAYATNTQGTSYGDEVSFTTKAAKPTVTTSSASNITLTSATVGGNVTSSSGADVTERGVVWSTTKNPTTSGDKKQVGSGQGSFSTELTGLEVATTYYVRAYAINSVGTAYGEELSFTTKAEGANEDVGNEEFEWEE